MARTNIKLALLLAAVAFTGLLPLSAQGTPYTVGPLTVNIPPGWTKNDSFGTVSFYSPDSRPPQQFLRVQLSTEETTQSVSQRHATIIGNLSSAMRPGTAPQNGATGNFIWTRIEVQLPDGGQTIVWYSAKAGSTYVAVMVETSSADLLARNLPAVDAMLARASLKGAPPATGASNQPPASAGNAAAAGPGAVGLASLDEYVFTPPAGWAAQRASDFILISSPPSETNEKCMLWLLPMRPAGANLLQDAYNAFGEVWLRDFVLRNQTPAGFAFPESVIHGYSGQGWEYVIVRKGIAQRNSQESRLGFVMVAKLDNRLAVISGLSKDPLVSACMGENRGTTNWPKFFYSLGFKSWTPQDQTATMRKRLAGEWIAATATAGDLITFAGNGRFANAAAAQQYHLGTNELITTTQAYFGNGSYTLRGNAITMKQDDGKTIPGFFRIEQESKDDGRTWEDAFYLMRTSMIDGQEFELRFKRNR